MNRSVVLMLIVSLTMLLVGCVPLQLPSQQESEPTRPVAENNLATSTPSPAPTDQPIATTVPPTTAPEAAVLTAADVQRIAPAEAFELVNAGSAVLLDARSPAQFSQLHIAGALSFPELSAAENLATLPSGMALIFYCT